MKSVSERVWGEKEGRGKGEEKEEHIPPEFSMSENNLNRERNLLEIWKDEMKIPEIGR